MSSVPLSVLVPKFAENAAVPEIGSMTHPQRAAPDAIPG
jgi:hypothetical protein